MPLLLSKDEFKLQLQLGEPVELARMFGLSKTVHALPHAIVGSGNWRYSLNPEKLLNEYHEKSDIDVAVVSSQLYQETWDEMRRLHRDRWYALDYNERARLNRNGQNIYAGFACPTWLPQLGHPRVYSFKSMLSKLSGPDVGYREVKMFYFKNETELIDYYRRGFIDAKRSLSQ